MTKNFFAALIAALALVVFAPVAALAAAETQSIETSFALYSACVGEYIAVTGTVHTVSNVTNPAGGISVTSQVSWSSVQGVGLTTGNKYTVVSGNNFAFSASGGSGQHEFSSLGRTGVIAQGRAPDSWLSFRYHVTVNADGRTTASISDFSTTCR